MPSFFAHSCNVTASLGNTIRPEGLGPSRSHTTASSRARLRANRAARRVVYVSCDPSTQARDAAAFLSAGYELREVLPFDLFPQTRHIEAVAVFDRRAPGDAPLPLGSDAHLAEPLGSDVATNSGPGGTSDGARP